MFKDTKEGQTHSYNDGCGEPEHNDMSFIEKKVEEFRKSLDALSYKDYGCDGADECCGNCTGDRLSDYKIEDFLRTALEQQKQEIVEGVEALRKEIPKEDIEARYFNDEMVKTYNFALSEVRSLLEAFKKER